jgi:hypothetical protein
MAERKDVLAAVAVELATRALIRAAALRRFIAVRGIATEHEMAVFLDQRRAEIEKEVRAEIASCFEEAGKAPPGRTGKKSKTRRR